MEEEVSFSDIQSALNTLHTKDHDILSKIGLKQLEKNFSAYSVSLKGRSVIFLVPVDFGSKRLNGMTSSEASKHLTILGELPTSPKKWVKIWPKVRAAPDPESVPENERQNEVDDDEVDMTM